MSVSSESDEPDPLWSLSLLGLRWTALVWSTVLAGFLGDLRYPEAAAAVLVVALGWSVWVTIAPPAPASVAAGDLALAVVFLAGSGTAATVGQFATNHPLFAGLYPFVAIAMWSGTYSLRLGLPATGALVLALLTGYIVNGVDLLSGEVVPLAQFAGRVGGYVLTAGCVALAARGRHQLIVRGDDAWAAVRRLRLAVLTDVHDRVLAGLGLIRKRASELAELGPVPADDMRGIVKGIAEQERILRGLLADAAVPTDQVLVRDVFTEAVARSGLRARIMAGANLRIAPPDARILRGAVDEALTNIAKHAGTDRVWLTGFDDDGHLCVSVRDDGRGMPAVEPPSDRSSFGMRTMRMRMDELRGTCTVTSEPNRGTEVEFRFPTG